MSYTFECPFCNAKIDVPDELDNTSAQCPACGQEIYLTRDDAVEDLDPVVEQMRRDSAAADRARMNNLRQFAMLQQQKADSEARTKSIVNVLLWVFVWGPLCAIGGYLIFVCLFRVATGHW